MRRGKRALLFAVCAVVVAAFALTGCAGGEAKGEQVTKEQYEQILTKMLEAFPNVPQTSNAAMAAGESELQNFVIRSTDITKNASGTEILRSEATLEVDYRKIRTEAHMTSPIMGKFDAITYAYETNGVCWMNVYQNGKWDKIKLVEMEGDSSPFVSIRYMLTLLKDRFELFEYQDGKYVCKAEETPKLIAQLSLHTAGDEIVEQAASRYKNASLSLLFTDNRLAAIDMAYKAAGSMNMEAPGPEEMTSESHMQFTDYGKASVTLPQVA